MVVDPFGLKYVMVSWFVSSGLALDMILEQATSLSL